MAATTARETSPGCCDRVCEGVQEVIAASDVGLSSQIRSCSAWRIHPSNSVGPIGFQRRCTEKALV